MGLSVSSINSLPLFNSPLFSSPAVSSIPRMPVASVATASRPINHSTRLVKEAENRRKNCKRQFIKDLNSQASTYASNRTCEAFVSSLDVLSWTNFTPDIPILNYSLYKESKKQKNPPVWVSYVFRQEHLEKPVSSLINLQGEVKSLFLLLDVDDGTHKLVPSTEEDSVRRQQILSKVKKAPEPQYSMDSMTVAQFCHKSQKTGVVKLETCLDRFFNGEASTADQT